MSDAPSPKPPTHAADRLLAAIEAKRSPVCVGLDPVLEKLPQSVRNAGGDKAWRAIDDFCREIISEVAAHVPCIKFQSACFERHGPTGVVCLGYCIAFAKMCGLEVILDAKRGDIGVSAEHYAAAAFEQQYEPGGHPYKGNSDWLTINSYLGEDGITPFLAKPGHGAFALVRTSNPGGDAIQNLELKGGDGRTVSHAIAELVAQIGTKHVGERGFSSLGAVVGATKKQDAATLRRLMPQQIFLVPGYGAQGGGVDDVLPCFNADRTGAIITASRSVIYAFKPDDPKWMDSVADAAAKFADEIGTAVGMR